MACGLMTATASVHDLVLPESSELQTVADVRQEHVPCPPGSTEHGAMFDAALHGNRR